MPSPTDDDASHYFGEGAAAITIEKATNGADADSSPGPTVPVGDPVAWTYVVTNTGDYDLVAVAVTDDQGVTVICPATTLSIDAAMTCTGGGIAVLGQYGNVGSVTGDPVFGDGSPATLTDGSPVPSPTDDDASHYFGEGTAAITIEKATNGDDADSAPGPSLSLGDPVAWTYLVTNAGDYQLINVAVTDDQGVAVSCPATTLGPGTSMTCTGSGTADLGQYANIGTATGDPVFADGSPATSADGSPVDAPSASDPSHYLVALEPSVTLEKATDGFDADVAPGPTVAAGEAVVWTYVVTNTGNVALDDLAVTDDQGVVVTCPQTSLAAGATMTCSATGTAIAGQYANVGTVTGSYDDGSGTPAPVSPQSDPSHYFGADPDLIVEKATNGVDADSGTGPVVAVGGTVTWTYVVTNTGNAALTGVTIVDSVLGDVSTGCDWPVPGELAIDEATTCVVTGIATAGQYENGVVVGGSSPTGPVGDTDLSHYFGAEPSVGIEKATNGDDADGTAGPTLAVGAPVEWTYSVTNTGNVTLLDVAVTDDIEGPICTIGQLDPGATETCTVTGIASAGAYENLGTASGSPVAPTGDPADPWTAIPDGSGGTLGPAADSDPSHYVGVSPAIAIDKRTNATDSAGPADLLLDLGASIEWTYVVTNTGDTTLRGVVVLDDQEGVASCPQSVLTPGESMECTLAGSAIAGDYANVAEVTGTPVDTNGTVIPTAEPVSDNDQSGYRGRSVNLILGKRVDGDAEVAPGDRVTFVLDARNAGSDDDPGPITVVDVLPAGLLPVAATGDGWTCSILVQTVTCELASGLVAGGLAAPIEIDVTVGAAATGELVNTATVASTLVESTLADNTDDAGIVVSSESVATPAPPVQVPATPAAPSPEPAPPTNLADTGADTDQATGLAAMLLLFGASLVRLRRRWHR